MPVPVEQLIPFLIGATLVTIVPGADMALVMRQVLVGGTALAQRTIFGNVTGLIIHSIALAVGLSALLVASAEAYTVVKVAGGIYLVYLGAQSLRSAWRAGRERAIATSDPSTLAVTEASRGLPVGAGITSMRAAYLQGLVSTVLNPKPALLYLTFLPVFVDEARPVLPQIAFLAGIHIVMGLIWLTLYARVIARAHETLTRPDVRRWLEGATGVVLIGLGVRVATEPR